MKKRVLSIFLAGFIFLQPVESIAYAQNTVGDTTVQTGLNGNIPIDQEHFPDEVFRAYVLANLDTGAKDGVLDLEEQKAVQSITVYNYSQPDHLKIKNMEGIQYFENLRSLDCSGNKLQELDVSKNVKLETLKCSSNLLTSLDVSKNTALIMLDCGFNQLANLDLSSNLVLEYLSCYHNNLTKLDLSKNMSLTNVSCYTNQLTTLKFNDNSKIKSLYCGNNRFSSLNVSKLKFLQTLSSDYNKLTKLDVRYNTNLLYLSFKNNGLTSIDISKNTKLKQFYCSDNKLTTIKGNIKSLIELNCSNNQLTSVNLTAKRVYCDGNSYQMTKNSIDVSKLPDFDIKKLEKDSLINAKIKGNVITAIDKTKKITYKYRIGTSYKKTFTLLPASYVEPAKYYITLDPNGGEISTSKQMVIQGEKYFIYSHPRRKGYEFLGWYTAKKGGTEVSSKTVITKTKRHTLYAHWKKISVKKATIQKVTVNGQKLQIRMKKQSDVDGFRIYYSTNSKFTSKSTTMIGVRKTSYTTPRLKKNTKYYVKIRAFKDDSTNRTKFGPYSSVIKVTTK